MKRKTVVILAVLLAFTLVFAACSKQPSSSNGDEVEKGGNKYISIATSSTGGTFSIIGTAMSDVINKNVDGVTANIEITGGSAENLILASDKNVDLAMSASDVLYLATKGEGSFEGTKIENLKGVMGGHMTITQVYVLADSGIDSFDDLKGKKISLGPPGSVGNDAMKIIMDAYGYEINKDWTPEYLAHGDGAEALTDGNVDAVIIMSTAPCGPVSTAASSKKIKILDLDPDKLEQIVTENPFYIKSTIPGGIYPNVDEEVKYTFGSPALMVVHEDASEEDVYNVVKALYENNDELVKAYPQCDEWSVENATRGLEGIVEMHPGALKYLEEVDK